MTTTRRWSHALCAGLALAAAVSAHAGEGAAGPVSWEAVDDTVLDETRGGFDAGNGLLVSLAVDRLLSVNGSVVAASRVAVADAAQAAAGVPGGMSVLSAGGGNIALPAAALAGLALQNSASGQMIQARMTIDAAVNTLGALKNLNFGDSLRQALSTAIAPR
jgi:hypothetical protein